MFKCFPSERLGSAYFSCVQTYRYIHVNITTGQSYVHLNFTIYLKTYATGRLGVKSLTMCHLKSTISNNILLAMTDILLTSINLELT